jgi:hypothetical protein
MFSYTILEKQKHDPVFIAEIQELERSIEQAIAFKKKKFQHKGSKVQSWIFASSLNLCVEISFS